MGADYSVAHAAVLCVQLPSESRVARAQSDGWSEQERLLAAIGRGVDTIWWQKTKDGQKRGAVSPDRYPSPHKRLEIERKTRAYSRDEINEIADLLGIPDERR